MLRLQWKQQKMLLSMKNSIRLEELAMLGISIYALYYFKVEWWYYLLLFLGPDISMLGYLVGNKVGAVTYNLFHYKGVAILIFLVGLYTQARLLQVIGIILFGHSAMDRVLGYGLKYYKGFQHTHLGYIGKTNVTVDN